MRKFLFLLALMIFAGGAAIAKDDNHGEPCPHQDEGPYNPANTAFHHISDANVFSIGPVSIPLPCILYAPGHGWDIFSSSKFEPGHHSTGHYAYKGYVLVEGLVQRVPDESFPQDKVSVCIHLEKEEGKEVAIITHNGHEYHADQRSTADGGVFGGGITSFYDFSLTKNVVTMILTLLVGLWMFVVVANGYKKRSGKAPKGIQSFIEPMFLFIRDEVAIPFLGNKHLKFLPFLMSLFFFILLLNMIGQLPFIGNPNVTGNLAITAVLAIITFVVTNINGKKDYWKHVFWMPGIPAWTKLIITPVEFLGLFIKPITLMLRLFANITAGHLVILSFIGLIFIFGNSGESASGATIGAVAAVPLALFMMAIELLVAFIQAFVFTILAASYIGAAIEEHHH